MTSDSRKKLLLVWWYDRRDLIAPYLEMLDSFDITVLFYRFPEQENAEVAEKLPFKRIFWTHYNTPGQILRDVKPDRVVVFGIESPTTLSLLIAAKSKNIPTFYVSHGLALSLKDRLGLNKNTIQHQVDKRYSADNPHYINKKWHSVFFFLSSIKWYSFQHLLFLFSYLISVFRRLDPFLRLKYLPSKIWMPDKFLLYATSQSQFFKELMNIYDDQIIYTGPYLMDKIFRDYNFAKALPDKNTYWLFIDQPLKVIKTEDRMHLIQKLEVIAATFGKKLYLKLHPQDYKKDFYSLKNVVLIKDYDHMPDLIYNSEICLGFNSAMLLSIIPFKKCYLFDHPALGLIKDWASTGAVSVLDFHTFNASDFKPEEFKVNDESVNHFVNLYLMYTDGKCNQRLKYALLQSV